MSDFSSTSGYWYLEKWEEHLSLFFLIAIVVAPVFLTDVFNSRQTNSLVTELQAAFCLANARNSIKCIYRGAVFEFVPFLLFSAFVICSFGWFFSAFDFHQELRFYFYIIQYLFFLSLVSFFDDNGMVLWKVFLAKGMALLAIVLIFFYARFSYEFSVWESSIKPHPPLYRHIRHFNYDLFIFMGLLCWAYVRRLVNYPVFATCLTLIGFLTAWSGARGQAVATIILLSLLLLSFRRDAARLARSILFWLVFGALALYFSGETYMLYESVANSGRGSVNGISSGRLAIWAATWEAAQSNLIFGLGPEAFYNNNVVEANIVQPHSLIFQLVIEFGFIGLLAVVIAMCALLYKTFLLTYFKEVSLEVIFMYFLFISILAFSLVDGLFYHGVPFSLSMIILSYIYKISRNLWRSRGPM